MLDFTKIGILLGIMPFTKKFPKFYQHQDFRIFSCVNMKQMSFICVYVIYLT